MTITTRCGWPTVLRVPFRVGEHVLYLYSLYKARDSVSKRNSCCKAKHPVQTESRGSGPSISTETYSLLRGKQKSKTSSNGHKTLSVLVQVPKAITAKINSLVILRYKKKFEPSSMQAPIMSSEVLLLPKACPAVFTSIGPLPLMHSGVVLQEILSIEEFTVARAASELALLFVNASHVTLERKFPRKSDLTTVTGVQSAFPMNEPVIPQVSCCPTSGVAYLAYVLMRRMSNYPRVE